MKNQLPIKISLGLYLCSLALSLWAKPLLPNEIPASLQPWVDWVLYEHDERYCPFLYNHVPPSEVIKEDSGRVCHWPARLTLNVTGNQAEFSQEWQMYNEGWVALPGNSASLNAVWPQAVQINGVPMIVTDREGTPSVFLAKGQVTLRGQFRWQHRPEFLQVPEETGLIALTIDNVAVPIPELDDKGRLWLRQRGSQSEDEGTEESRLDMRVYRRVIDDIPLQVITRIELDVAGKYREVVLGPALLDKHLPMSLDSPLPARLETDGRLRVQVRPGAWVMTLQTRQLDTVQTHHNDVTTVAARTVVPDNSKTPPLWVNEETWVFEARNELRLVEVSGVIEIDAKQTTLPTDWRKFPAYLLKSGDNFNLIEKRRGDPEPAPDQLRLQRHFWLDFDGQGYTVQDYITGQMTQRWRLEMLDSMATPTTTERTAQLGRVSVNGDDQFITRLSNTGPMGVEVRRGQINLVADSRLELAKDELSAVGWEHDFQKVSLTLDLPPGWQLLEAEGVDEVSNTWFKRWTLLDLFVVLIVSMAIGKLWRWTYGILALITLVLTYHEPEAPQLIWLHILVAIALLRVLPEMSWFSTFTRLYRNIGIITLLIMVLPFMLQQVRQSLYPQLEHPWVTLGESTLLFGTISTGSSTPMRGGASAPRIATNTMENRPQQQMQHVQTEEEQSINDASSKTMPNSLPAAPPPPIESYSAGKAAESPSDKENAYSYRSVPKKKSASAQRKQLAQIDPNAQVQTGPGLPQWQWRQVTMNWNGPVERHQKVQLWLISPAISSVLAGVRTVLLGLLTAFLLWTAWGKNARLSKPTSNPQSDVSTNKSVLTFLIVPLLACCIAMGLLVPRAEAAEPPTASNATATDLPEPQLLNELQKRLLAPPDCLPYCASSPRMRIDLEANQLQIRMEIHSYSDVAIPLPGAAQQWLAQQVWLDSESAQGLWRSENGELWLHLSKGIHQVQLSGLVPNQQSIQLPLPLKPHWVDVQAKGWRVEGLHENGLADNQLQFTREQDDTPPGADLQMGTLPPFIRIERTLLLGLDWQIETHVTRLTPSGSAIVLEIPLLPGESVTSESVRVDGGKALINLSPSDAEVSWTSVFAKQDIIQLVAPDSLYSTEIWRLDVSAIWHVDISGIPVVHHQNAEGRWLPEWRPWPKESVNLHFSRPEGVTGQVLTIDRSNLSVTPGQRTSDNSLNLTLRSSRGGQHFLTLPKDAQLQSVLINGTSQPIRQQGNMVTLPITPGTQNVQLTFRQPVGMSEYFQTSAVGLGLNSVNTHVQIHMPSDRWILFTGGAAMGPAVLIWGIIVVLVLISIGLGRVDLTPLKTYEWLLLGLVLSQVTVIEALCVIGWLLALGWRARLPNMRDWQFNFTQLGLIAFTIVAAGILLYAIHQGLLGQPDMHIAGNGSSASLLRWYQDRTTGTLPIVWVISLPLWVYHIAMLLWALWLAFAMMRWAKWGWQCFNTQGLWKRLGWLTKKKVEVSQTSVVNP